MKIRKVWVDNFRNLNNLTIEFHELSNYLIGENNLGKSNFLDVLNCVFNGKKFEDEDFCSSEKSIEVRVTLYLNEFEKGFFGDNFSPEDSSNLTILYKQGINDSFPTVSCVDTDESIPIKQLRKLHYFRYASTAVPTKELRIDSANAAGKVFNGIANMYLQDETHDTAFLHKENVAELANYINERLSKIKGFSQYGIKATVADNCTEMLSGLFFLSDDTRRIETTGSGIQYIAMITLNIVSQILSIYNNKATKFEEQLYTNEEGNKILPIVVALDEPEVHLHPYLQRSLITYYKSILLNNDNDFLRLLNDCFNIDGLDGQLLIVTHSSDILVDDYRNIIRFFKQDHITQVVSANAFAKHFDKNVNKQLVMHFHELREAFYAHCVILVEGETEYGCLPYFAEKIGVSLDDHCISVIMARGENSIKPLKKLLGYFNIPSVSIYDGDVKTKRTSEDGINFFTSELCFELEVIKSLYSKGQTELIKTIAIEMNKQADNLVLDSDFVKSGFKYLKLPLDEYTPKKLADVDETDESEFCNIYAVWFMKYKGVISGRIIGNDVPSDCIPLCYSSAINKALEMSVQ